MTEEILQKYSVRFAPFFILVATAIGYLVPRGYPLFSSEIALLFIYISLIGFALGAACSKTNDFFRCIILGVLYTLFLVFVFRLIGRLQSITVDVIHYQLIRHSLKLFIAFILPMLLCYILRRHINLSSCVAMPVFIIGCFVSPGNDNTHPTSANSTSIQGERSEPPKKLYLHIILDEFVGNAGISKTFPNGEKLRQDISTYFLKHKFQLHEGAFSTYPYTAFSVPALYSFSRPHPADIPQDGEFSWFKALNKNGYKVKYISTDLLQVCESKNKKHYLSECISYKPDITSVHYTSLSAHKKLEKILYVATITNTTQTFSAFLKKMHILNIHQQSNSNDEFDPFSGQIIAFDKTKQMLLESGGNTAIISHILLPHGAMVYDENCNLKADNALIEATSTYSKSRTDYEIVYSKQIYCTLKKLNELIDIVDKRWPTSTIIVNGDHGLRLMPFKNTPEDIRLRHAALFAIRGKDYKPGIITNDENLQMLFARYAGNINIPDSRILYRDLPDPEKTLVYPKKIN